MTWNQLKFLYFNRDKEFSTLPQIQSISKQESLESSTILINGSLYPYGLQTEEKQGDFVSPFNLQPINY